MRSNEPTTNKISYKLALMKSADKEMNVISENQTMFFNSVGFFLKKNIYQSQFINSEEVR